jgi:hypothetical protein
MRRLAYIRLMTRSITVAALQLPLPGPMQPNIDAVTARMICTYRGPGTQYRIEGDKVAPDTIHDVPQGSAIILRGTDWPTSGQTRLRHRSPPIEGTDTTRLLVVLDPVAGLEDDE